MGRMLSPPHPGVTLRDDVLPELGLSVTEAAEQLGVARVTLSRELNGRAAISPEMALRLQVWLGRQRSGNARVWLAQQTAHDLWQAEQKLKRARLRVRPVPVAA
ncbi:MAG: HigA family addiction module antidote protein [Burkholderiaceae bacterium]|nr:HigA family addiction module antidote protein [Burkholderiaceae bacterium]